MKKIILVDKNDKQIGAGEKLEIHKQGKLHRAFSIFVFNSKRQVLLQKRAKHKYHCAGLWSNTCCSHPRADEPLEKTAHKRLKQEMGFDCKLKKIFEFSYKASFDNGLTENEYDHVFVGHFNGEPVLNPDEASDAKWYNIDELKQDISKNPEKYTFWLKACLDKVINALGD